MTRRDGLSIGSRWTRLVLGLGLLSLITLVFPPRPLQGQSGVPTDKIHLSVALGGYFLVGLGYTHFVEDHSALEFTVFPFAYPREGFPFGLRAGYAWVPSDEVWRAKLGLNMTVLIRPGQTGGDRFTPILALTPGIQYDPDSDRSFRTDLWMSYYLKEKVFAPTAVEFLYAWPK
ncbi:MAG: hypothetical protein MUO50_03005 [Longimicrobiales bacterium]|nr:hypothetical protein [Longimicrobiales bacterium]